MVCHAFFYECELCTRVFTISRPIILFIALYAYRSPYSNCFAKIVNCQMRRGDEELLYAGFVELDHAAKSL